MRDVNEYLLVRAGAYVVCVCVCERERGERENTRGQLVHSEHFLPCPVVDAKSRRMRGRWKPGLVLFGLCPTTCCCAWPLGLSERACPAWWSGVVTEASFNQCYTVHV